MGIVVTIFMLLGLLMLSPWDKLSLGKYRHHAHVANTVGVGLLLAGLWNALWHGLRYLDYFWGIAGLVSGIFMVFVAIMAIKQYTNNLLSSHSLIHTFNNLLQPIKAICLVGLLLSFLLYATTLIQLNLGMPILG